MPFKSYKQQEYMFIHHPKIAKRWAKKYGTLKKPSGYGQNKKRALSGHTDSVALKALRAIKRR